MDGVVRRYIDFLITLIPTLLILALFCRCIPTSLSIFNFSPVFIHVIFVQYSKCCSKNIQDRSKIDMTRTWQYNYIDKNVHVHQLQIPRLLCAKYQVTFHENCR